MAKTLLEGVTTATASSEHIATEGVLGLPAVFTCPGLAGVETGTLQMKNADGTFSDCYEDGSLVQVTVDATQVAVYAPGIYRVNKSSTAAAVPVEVHTPGNP